MNVILDKSVLYDFFESELPFPVDTKYHTLLIDELSFKPKFNHFDRINFIQPSSFATFLSRTTDQVFVSDNYNLNQIISKQFGVKTQLFKHPSLPSGIDEKHCNSFQFIKGKLYFKNHKQKIIRVHGKYRPWRIKPDTIYQEMFISLLMNNELALVSCLSDAGFGKTFLSLACAFEQILVQKQFDRIIILKSTHEVGRPLGFLPGDIDCKIASYFEYAEELCQKLAQFKPVTNFEDFVFFKPINYLRGTTLENSFVIIDEAQNLSASEIRTVLTRLGMNTKAVVLGDINQIDVNHKEENGLSHMIRKLIGQKEFAHVTLKGQCSRGVICDMVQRVSL